MYTYDTLSQAVNGLKERGYGIDFNLEFDCITCKQTLVSLLPSEFEITEVYRFEGDSNPDDESVVYAIESKHGHKGVLVNGYGISADPIGDEMVKKLATNYTN
ncbi:MAG: phosphoribosylpyrophosphate synthetase [Bacteroidetes bacterium]|nr:phosphoribosylpyrophosphate synthetase [Bacteroidota bacterium]